MTRGVSIQLPLLSSRQTSKKRKFPEPQQQSGKNVSMLQQQVAKQQQQEMAQILAGLSQSNKKPTPKQQQVADILTSFSQRMKPDKSNSLKETPRGITYDRRRIRRLKPWRVMRRKTELGNLHTYEEALKVLDVYNQEYDRSHDHANAVKKARSKSVQLIAKHK